jgi:subtilisin
MIGAPLEWPETKGKGIKVAVIDTGKPNHSDLRIADYVDFTGTGVEDRRGHSTHCCGIIAANGKIKGVAPEVELVTLKVFPDQGSASPAAIAGALQWCQKNKIDIISMSFGSPSDDSSIRQEIKKCYEAGIVMVAAAGNFGRDYGVLYPAKYPEVLAVAAVDIDKKPAEWSAYGLELDLAAAGVDVYSTYLNGQYALLSGTSMACPHIAGACAILQAKALKRFGRKLAPEEIRVALNLYADDLGVPGKDERYGFGVFSFGRFHADDTVPREVVMTIGQKEYTVNGLKSTMDVAPFLKDGRTFVPVRFVAEGLNARVEWDEKTRKVTITL